MSNSADREDELRRLGEELRTVFADERTAIGKLDHEALTFLAERKRQVAEAIAAIQPPEHKSPELREYMCPENEKDFDRLVGK